MTGKFKARLFLTNSEQESLLELADEIQNSEVETMEQHEKMMNWQSIITSLVFGKKLNNHEEVSFPVSSTSIELTGD